MIDLRQKPTTIWIKKGTKDELDSYGKRKDSYDDIIKNILIENNQLKNKLEQLESLKPKNRLILRERKEASIEIKKNVRLIFTYNNVPKAIEDDYRMNIHITGIQKAGKIIKPKDYYKGKAERLKDYLKSIGAIIRSQINPLFKIEEDKLLDVQEWRRLFRNNGLSERALKSDIEEEFIKSGMII